MKTKEEINAQKKEVETVNKKLAELNEEELAEVMGGAAGYLEVETVPTDLHSVQMPTPETKEEALHRIEVVTHQKIEEISPGEYIITTPASEQLKPRPDYISITSSSLEMNTVQIGNEFQGVIQNQRSL